MKGNSPWNKPSIRKTDVYRLLLDLGGEARWKDLKMHLDKLGWGPTTLKQTLDEMTKEGSVIKEARLGPKRPEAWYKVEIKDADIWKHLKRACQERDDAKVEQIVENAKKKMRELEGKEKELFIKSFLRSEVKLAESMYAALFLYLLLKLEEWGKDGVLRTFNYIFDTAFKDDTTDHLKILLEYPQYSVEVISDTLKEYEKK
jgi:hypothetical protein